MSEDKMKHKKTRFDTNLVSYSRSKGNYCCFSFTIFIKRKKIMNTIK